MLDNAILRRAAGSHRIGTLAEMPTGRLTNPKLPRSRLLILNPKVVTSAVCRLYGQ